MLVLLGVAVVVTGFVIRLNPLLVIAAAALVTGVAASLSPLAVIAAFGKAFNDSRYISLVFLVVPVIGLLERHGLQERARMLLARLRAATPGRLLLAYLVFRQVFASVGLTLAASQVCCSGQPFVSDRTDGKIAHLDGLNLSRAWCWRLVADAIENRETHALIDETIARHLVSALPHVTGDYLGEHWLASFALLALDHAVKSPDSSAR